MASPRPTGADPLGAGAGRRRRQGAFLCTDLKPTEILGWFVRRWRVEVTFAEVRRHLGVERQCLAILRTTPALLGLFSLVTIGDFLPRRRLRGGYRRDLGHSASGGPAETRFRIRGFESGHENIQGRRGGASGRRATGDDVEAFLQSDRAQAVARPRHPGIDAPVVARRIVGFDLMERPGRSLATDDKIRPSRTAAAMPLRAVGMDARASQ
jgi:hypothetical protein